MNLIAGVQVHIVSFSILLFIVNIIQLVIWTLYIIATISRDKKYFYIDAYNIYHRGEWYIVSIDI